MVAGFVCLLVHLSTLQLLSRRKDRWLEVEIESVISRPAFLNSFSLLMLNTSLLLSTCCLHISLPHGPGQPLCRKEAVMTPQHTQITAHAHIQTPESTGQPSSDPSRPVHSCCKPLPLSVASHRGLTNWSLKTWSSGQEAADTLKSHVFAFHCDYVGPIGFGGFSIKKGI